MKILVAEDDSQVGAVILASLQRAGHVVDLVARGDEALWMAQETAPDLVILDICLPAMDGLEVCKALREAGFAHPILVLTGRGAVEDRVKGLDAGADDYLAKPFDVDELMARVRALARRPPAAPRAVLVAGDLCMDLATRVATRGGEPIDLTAKEAAVLETLMRNAGAVVSRDRLLASAWDFAFDPQSNVVDAFIRLLRRKIDTPNAPSRIETVRGVGYRLRKET